MRGAISIWKWLNGEKGKRGIGVDGEGLPACYVGRGQIWAPAHGGGADSLCLEVERLTAA